MIFGEKTHAFHRGQPNRSEEKGLPHSSIRMNSEASCGCFCEEGEFVEKFDQTTASMTLEALIIA